MTPTPETELFDFTVAQALFDLPDHIGLEAAPTRAPLMTLLVTLGRPRTLVQFGLRRAGPYIAACSTARRRHTETACYGLWSEPQEPPLLAHLQGVVTPFHPASALMCGSKERLAADFPDAGVDLLWLDEPCDPKCWEAWRPKLSTRAVVAVSDIWRRPESDAEPDLWNELKTNNRSIELGLGEGFGVALVGSNPPPALLGAVEAWASRPSFRELLSSSYEQAERSLPERIEARWRAQDQERQPA